jgi:hypothetical protein
MADAHLQSAIQVHLQHGLIPTSRAVSISIALQDAWFDKEHRRGNPGRGSDLGDLRHPHPLNLCRVARVTGILDRMGKPTDR